LICNDQAIPLACFEKTKIMKTKILKTSAVMCCFIALMAFVADVSGKWSGTLPTPDGQTIPVTYNFKVDGDNVTGTAESPNGQVTVDNGKIKGDSILFKVTVDGNDYPHAGKIYTDSIGMNVIFGGTKVHFTLKKG
jgi:hypothetical protein